MNLNKALFGGALMAAGMTANAQTFIYNATDTTGEFSSFAYSLAAGGYLDESNASGALNTSSTGYSYEIGTTTVSTSQTANSMRVDGQWDGGGYLPFLGGYGESVMQQFFQVSANADLIIEWDYSGTNGFPARAFVLQDPTLDVLFEVGGLAGGPTSGSVTISLTAGTDYAVVMWMGNTFFETENQFISMTLVPAPGAIAVLGLGGLVATRRRR